MAIHLFFFKGVVQPDAWHGVISCGLLFDINASSFKLSTLYVINIMLIYCSLCIVR